MQAIDKQTLGNKGKAIDKQTLGNKGWLLPNTRK
jgi:hypothetical protein